MPATRRGRPLCSGRICATQGGEQMIRKVLECGCEVIIASFHTSYDRPRSPRHSRICDIGKQKARGRHARVTGRARFLEPHIQPAWLIPQFRHNLDGEQERDYAAREGQQQVFRATFPGIRDSVSALIVRRMDALARKFHETHDTAVSDAIYGLSRELIKLNEPWRFVSR